jgi:hypothetical protein
MPSNALTPSSLVAAESRPRARERGTLLRLQKTTLAFRHSNRVLFASAELSWKLRRYSFNSFNSSKKVVGSASHKVAHKIRLLLQIRDGVQRNVDEYAVAARAM